MKRLMIFSLLIPLTGCAMFSVPGSVDYANGTSTISSTGGSIEFDVKDIPTGCHDWHGQGSANGSEINVECTYTPSTGQFIKKLNIKSLTTLEQLIEANKLNQAVTAQALAALSQAISLLKSAAPAP